MHTFVERRRHNQEKVVDYLPESSKDYDSCRRKVLVTMDGVCKLVMPCISSSENFENFEKAVGY